MSHYVPANVKRYWDLVASQGCMVTGDTHRVTLHHVHGGSIVERGFHRSSGRKTSDWLVIGLREDLHVGPRGIDGPDRIPVRVWESEHGNQADMVDEVIRRTGLDVWELARAEEKRMVPRRTS